MTPLSPNPPRARQAAGRLCVIASIAAAPAWLHAQTRLEPIVVTATREAQAIDHVSADVVLIGSAQIAASTATTLEELLRQHAGVQLSRNGGPGQSASVLIRGAGASSTVVLVDGVRVGSATLGQTALESIALSQVERIEVMRGPGSSLYGADAVGGVVQIFTRRGGPASAVSAHLAAGSHGSALAEADASGRSGAFDYAVGASHERSDGVSTLRPGDQFGNHNPDRDGFRRGAGHAALGWTPATGHRLGLLVTESHNDAQYDASEFNPPTFAQDNRPDFRSRLRARVVALDYRGRIEPRWTSSVKLARHDDDSDAGGTVINRFLTRRDQLGWQNAFDIAAGQQLVVALERQLEKVDGTPFATRLTRDNDAVVLGYSGRFGPHVVQADWRRDVNSAYGGVGTGRLGYSVELLAGFRVRALAGTSFRAPTFNDLFYPGFGVATVEPERGRSIEFGISWSGRDADVALTVYRNRVDKLIAYEPDRRLCPPAAAYNFGCARNINEAQLQGAHLSAGKSWGGLSLRAALDFLDAVDARTGTRLNRRAAFQHVIDAGWRPDARWTLGATVVGIGARPDGGVTLAAETTLDLRANWRVDRHWQLEAKLLNATDRDQQPVRDYQGLGRQAWLGLRYEGRGL
ncbi:TonB-dependent receptor domain-containing protein [Piscinibacter sakaiensis]|uniref:TonB-dependent receptor domain-containing protein n=1 Tax=Piscinibacter sakaiensis TaxID=1547922 RepID=UPI003AAADDCB